MAKKSAAQRIEKPLTPVELEMMNVIWRLGPCSVHQVLEALKPQRELAYTSVSTIVRILEQKGFLTSAKEGRGHIYAPTLTREAYQAMSLEQLVSNVFGGEPALLVQRLLDSRRLSTDELDRIKAALKKKGR